jgi:hypothetical protein
MSGNNFHKAASDPKGLEQALIGPSYPYSQFIKMPKQMGMSGDGGMDHLGNDIEGIMSYVDILVSGGGAASVTGKPLGNKYFVPIQGIQCTPSGKVPCKDAAGATIPCPGVEDGLAPRSIYIDNVPSGNIPFLSDATGSDFSEFRGLVPGILQSAEGLDPLALFGGFLQGAHPPCSYVNMEVIDNSNVTTRQGGWVLDSELTGMDPCSFPGGSGNPLTGASCREAFQGGRGDRLGPGGEQHHPHPQQHRHPHPLGPGGTRRPRRTLSMAPTAEELVAGGVTLALAYAALRTLG